MFAQILKCTFALLCYLAAALGAQPASAARTAVIAKQMARHLFQDSGYPVLVRRTDNLDDCQALNAGDRSWIAQEGDVVTEFLYDSKAICVTVFLRTSQSGNSAVRFDPAKFEDKFGLVPNGGFSVRQRLGFQFADNASAPLDDQALNFFFLQVPRPVNLKHAGSLAAAMRDFESPEAGAQFVTQVTGVASKNLAAAKPAPTEMPSMARPAAILAVCAALFGAGLFLYFHFRSAVSRADTDKLQASAATPAPIAPPIARPQPVEANRSGRDALSFPAHCVEDQKLLIEIDYLLRDLAGKGRVQPMQLEAITKQTVRLHAMAIKQELPALELVRDYLSEQLKEALRSNEISAREVKVKA